MACLNPQRAEDAINKIHDEIPEADLEFIPLDLSSQKSVANFANEYRRKYDHLDVLVNNVGIMAAPYLVTEDGFEGHCARTSNNNKILSVYLKNKLSVLKYGTSNLIINN